MQWLASGGGGGCPVKKNLAKRIVIKKMSNLFELEYWKELDTPPHSLKDSNVSLKVKTTYEEKVGVHSLICNTLGVEGRVRALRWGLRQMTSGSIIHTDLHKPNNKLTNV
jgi:hypothetical protein